MQPWIRPVDGAVRPEAVGLWRVPTADRHRRISPTVVGNPGTVRFLYDGQTVVMMLFTEKEWMWRAPDDHYRLAAEWRGDSLYYRPPFADFVELARFAGGRFESTRDTPPYLYEKVPSRAACDPDDLPLLAERELHDYTIKPMDRR